MTRLDFFRERIPIYRANPVLFAEEIVEFTPDGWQQKTLLDLSDASKVAVKSGQGVGKTCVEALAVLWFLSCFPYARVVATAPTRQQLNDVLWSEISKWMTKSALLSEILRWTKTYIYLQGYEKRWFAVARTATKPENMQGFHEDNMLFVVDEASGVADAIMQAILGTLSGQNNKLLLMGNPTQTTGTFHDAFTTDRAIYRLHTVNSEDSPRTNKENIAAIIRKYGRDSNVVRVRVLGEFPLVDDDVLIPLSVVERSVATELVSFDTDDNDREVIIRPITNIDIGCDVARFGDDKTIISYKVNERVEIYQKVNGQDTVRTAHKIAQLAQHLYERYAEKAPEGMRFRGSIPVKVDDGGVGGGVVDKLREIKRLEPKRYAWMEIFPVNFGQPIKHRYYHDSTTYMMAVVRDLLSPVDDEGRSKPVEVVLPNDPDLIAQLSTRKYEFRGNSKMVVESKKAYKERTGGTSPDEADCILLVCLPVSIKDTKKGAK